MATNDCLPCHFEFEEETLLPYLPKRYQAWLRRRHREIREDGYPAAEVISHAEEEMALFRRYCPPELVRVIEEDHAAYHPVLERYAAAGLDSPTTKIT